MKSFNRREVPNGVRPCGTRFVAPGALVLVATVATLATLSLPGRAAPAPGGKTAPIKTASVAVTPGFRPSEYPGVQVRFMPGGPSPRKGAPAMIYLKPGHTAAALGSARKSSAVAAAPAPVIRTTAKGTIVEVPRGYFNFEKVPRVKPKQTAALSSQTPTTVSAPPSR